MNSFLVIYNVNVGQVAAANYVFVFFPFNLLQKTMAKTLSALWFLATAFFKLCLKAMLDDVTHAHSNSQSMFCQLIWLYYSILHCRYFLFFFTLPRWRMNDGHGLGCRHSSSSSSILWETREDGGKLGGSSIIPYWDRESEWDGVLRKRRCRRLGLAEGSPSRNIYTHARIHRGRITLIYLASVFSALTPGLQKYYSSLSSPSFGVVCVLRRTDASSVLAGFSAFVSVCVCALC